MPEPGTDLELQAGLGVELDPRAVGEREGLARRHGRDNVLKNCGRGRAGQNTSATAAAAVSAAPAISGRRNQGCG